jgi:DNA-binding NtrC family response regulator
MDERPKVLIIEDNLDLLNILEQLLGGEYDVDTARRGEDGVTLALEWKPDVVILGKAHRFASESRVDVNHAAVPLDLAAVTHAPDTPVRTP